MTDFTIRPARPGDEAAIHAAHMRSICEICVKDHGPDEVRGWGNRPLGNRWVDNIKNWHVWVVESGDGIFGHACLRLYTDEETGEPRAHIHGLYLTPECLGQGFGLKLASLMIGTARNAGMHRITLEASLTGHGFYKRLGFAETGPLSWQEIGGYPVRYYPMALDLPEK